MESKAIPPVVIPFGDHAYTGRSEALMRAAFAAGLIPESAADSGTAWTWCYDISDGLTELRSNVSSAWSALRHNANDRLLVDRYGNVTVDLGVPTDHLSQDEKETLAEKAVVEFLRDNVVFSVSGAHPALMVFDGRGFVYETSGGLMFGFIRKPQDWDDSVRVGRSLVFVQHPSGKWHEESTLLLSVYLGGWNIGPLPYGQELITDLFFDQV